MVVYGIGTATVKAMQSAAATWLVSALILLPQRVSLGLHVTVLMVSLVVLTVLELERGSTTATRSVSRALRLAEWITMTVPLGLAGWDMFGSLGYGFLFAAEGVALTVWAAASRVRRRAFLGLAAVATPIVLAVAIPVVEGARRGLAGGTWLVLGAVTAVLLMFAGSMIEKGRSRVGGKLGRFGEILEDWE